MKIPWTYYLKFWLLNSSLALGTSVILGIMSKVLLITLPIVMFLAFQVVILTYFWGGKRGAFEFAYIESIEKSKNKEISLIISMAKKERKLGDVSSANIILREAIQVFEDNFVLLVRYAISCENMNFKEDAIAAYVSALAKMPGQSIKLQQFIQQQIDRVQLEGPTKKSSAPGLQYVIF